MTNALYYGDNLEILRDHIAAESVDLIYLDPPFNSQATYNVLFRSPTGEQSEAQIEAFEDTWHWGPEAEDAFDQVMKSGHTDAAEMLRALRSFLVSQISRKTYLMTDEAPVYKRTGREFAGHGTVNHSIEEYVRGHFWHTNTVENYFSILKRGITGVYQHCSPQHLKRYVGEFDFRYNTRGVDDMARTAIMAKGIQGKRLTYRRTDARA